MEKNRPMYSMAMVRKMTGLTDRQIRYYEEVGLIKPARTQGKQRIFSSEEVDRLNEIKELLAQGQTIVGVKEKIMGQSISGFVSPDLRSITRLPGTGTGLTSLYPVSNRAQLVEMIVQRRRAREKSSVETNEN